jgi:hypothetical protein
VADLAGVVETKDVAHRLVAMLALLEAALGQNGSGHARRLAVVVAAVAVALGREEAQMRPASLACPLDETRDRRGGDHVQRRPLADVPGAASSESRMDEHIGRPPRARDRT